MSYKIEVSGNFGKITKVIHTMEVARTLATEIIKEGLCINQDDMATFFPPHRINLVKIIPGDD